LKRRAANRAATWLLAGGASLLVLGVAREARALPLLTLSANLRGLYGTSLGDEEVSPYGAGIGLSGGVTLPMSLCLGASFDYFFGETQAIQSGEVSVSSYQLLGHLGYDISLALLTLRPSLGVGLFHGSVEVGTDGRIGFTDVPGSSSTNDLVVAPGAELLLGLGLWSVSAEVRYDNVFADGDADGLFVGAGLGASL
jgi:hypothetical protein